MDADQRGIVFRSNPETYQHGAGITFKTDFLAKARQMAAPEIHTLTFEFSGTVGGVTATALGADAAKLIDTIRIKDADEIVNLSGAGARVLEQMEVGNFQVDPATVSSGATNTSYVYRLNLHLAPYWRAVRPRDFALPVQHLLDGGEITVQTAAAVPTGWNTIQNDWKLRIFAHVIDGRVRELKSRRKLTEVALTQQEFDYQVNGFLRSALITSKLTTTGYTSLASYTTLFSRTLEFPPAYQTHMLVDQYRRSARNIDTTTDEFVKSTPGAIPLYVPLADQLTGKMIDTRTLHLDLLTTAPASGRLITDVVIDRNGEQAAMYAGYPSAGELAQAVRAHGEVVLAGSESVAAGSFNASLARKLCIRIKPGSNK